MNKRGYWLCSLVIAVLLGGLARSAQAGKQFNYIMGAACQPAGLIGAVSPLTYTNSGFMIEGLTSVDVICPIAWAKPTPLGISNAPAAINNIRDIRFVLMFLLQP